jgi:hypothetical protein
LIERITATGSFLPLLGMVFIFFIPLAGGEAFRCFAVFFFTVFFVDDFFAAFFFISAPRYEIRETCHELHE